MRQSRLLLISLCCLGANAYAADAPPPREIGERLTSARHVDQAIARILNEFRRVAPDGRSVTLADVDLDEAKTQAQIRAGGVQKVLVFDLDGDGVVSREEVERLTDAQIARASDRGDGSRRWTDDHTRNEMLGHILVYDADRDGLITFQEMLSGAKTNPESVAAQRRGRPNAIVRYMIGQDPDGDGRLVIAEAEAIVRRDFAFIDTDGNGELSNNEIREYDKATRAQIEDTDRRPQRQTPACTWPGLPVGASVHAVGVYSGAALSSVSVVGQDRETGAVRVIVAPGEEAIHVLLSSLTEIVWVFEGAVGRVQSVALAAGRGNSGVSGVPADRIVQLAKDQCLIGYSQSRNGETAETLADHMLVSAGAGNVSVVSGYELYEVDMMAGEGRSKPKPPLTPQDGADRTIWASFMRFSPGGVVMVDPASVWVADGKAETYEVLPQEAGLLQLAAEGALAVSARSGYASAVYEVLKPMRRIPAGLNGAHGVTFLQPGDFPVPDGNIGHSCMFDIETDELILGNQMVCDRRQPR